MSNYSKDSASSSSQINPGSPLAVVSEETTHYSVADYLGNAVAATTTLNGTFGSSIVVDSAGFLLNNQMDDFSVKPGVPNMYGLIGGEANSIQTREKDAELNDSGHNRKRRETVYGGRFTRWFNNTDFGVQVVINVIDYGMNIRQAVDTGRFHHQWLPDFISYEKNSLDSGTIIEANRAWGMS